MANTTTEEKKNLKAYWGYFAISLLLCLALLFTYAEWFWVMLPFVLTFLVKAMDRM